jgi:hypothetical protein
MAEARRAELLAQSERENEELKATIQELTRRAELEARRAELLAQSERVAELLAQSERENEELKATIQELTRRLQENSNQSENFGSPPPSDDGRVASSSHGVEDEIGSPRITGGAAVISFLGANGEINRTLGTAGS